MTFPLFAWFIIFVAMFIFYCEYYQSKIMHISGCHVLTGKKPNPPAIENMQSAHAYSVDVRFKPTTLKV